MNEFVKYLLIALLVGVALAILVLLFRVLKNAVAKIPKLIVIIISVIALAIVIFLIAKLFKSTIGGASVSEPPVIETDEKVAINEKADESCILVSYDIIYIAGSEVSIEEAEAYIEYCVDNNIEMTIVDEYSSSVVFHSVVDMCEQKGVKYIIEDEKWLEE